MSINNPHIKECMQGIAYVQDTDLDPLDQSYKSRKVRLPESDKKKLAVFDMDETLIHCLGSQKYDDHSRKVNERGVELCAENSDVVLQGKGYQNKEDRH